MCHVYCHSVSNTGSKCAPCNITVSPIQGQDVPHALPQCLQYRVKKWHMHCHCVSSIRSKCATCTVIVSNTGSKCAPCTVTVTLIQGQIVTHALSLCLKYKIKMCHMHCHSVSSTGSKCATCTVTVSQAQAQKVAQAVTVFGIHCVHWKFLIKHYFQWVLFDIKMTWLSSPVTTFFPFHTSTCYSIGFISVTVKGQMPIALKSFPLQSIFDDLPWNELVRDCLTYCYPVTQENISNIPSAAVLASAYHSPHFGNKCWYSIDWTERINYMKFE